MNPKIKKIIDESGIPAIDESMLEKLVQETVTECASICYSADDDGDFYAMYLLYEFNVDNCRNDK